MSIIPQSSSSHLAGSDETNGMLNVKSKTIGYVIIEGAKTEKVPVQ
jgi:hypothetical protein